jgi:hypothetical protein
VRIRVKLEVIVCSLRIIIVLIKYVIYTVYHFCREDIPFIKSMHKGEPTSQIYYNFILCYKSTVGYNSNPREKE